MEFPGHVGAALAAYSPIAFVALVSGATRLALVGAAVAVALASFPDLDHYGPRMNHRGYSHTVWFAGLVGVGCAAAFAAVGPNPFAFQTASSGLVRPGVFGFAVGTAAILSHVAADALTPMGVAPLSPVVRRRYSLGVTRSASTTANRLFLLFGVGATVVAFGLGAALTG